MAVPFSNVIALHCGLALQNDSASANELNAFDVSQFPPVILPGTCLNCNGGAKWCDRSATAGACSDTDAKASSLPPSAAAAAAAAEKSALNPRGAVVASAPAPTTATDGCDDADNDSYSPVSSQHIEHISG